MDVSEVMWNWTRSPAPGGIAEPYRRADLFRERGDARTRAK